MVGIEINIIECRRVGPVGCNDKIVDTGIDLRSSTLVSQIKIFSTGQIGETKNTGLVGTGHLYDFPLFVHHEQIYRSKVLAREGINKYTAHGDHVVARSFD